MAVSDDEEDGEDLARRKAEASEKLVPPLAPGEYGVMPSRAYSNSQTVSASTIATETVPDSASTDQEPSRAEGPSSTIGERTKPVRHPILMRDKYDGVDSDDESDPNDEDIMHDPNELEDDEESDEDRPTVVGEIEIDMEAEEAEFLKFSREALGITENQWEEILSERSKRGGESTENVWIPRV